MGTSNTNIRIIRLYFTAIMLLTLVFAASAQAQNKKVKDNAYVTVSGTVEKITDADEFILNYKGGTIKVDTNDYWPNLFSKDAVEILKPGDRVTITGVVDDNLFTQKEIDATSIAYRGKTYSRVYWNTPYDENQYGYWPYYGWDDKMYDDRVSLSGTVNKIVSNDKFEMRYGTGTVQVDTSDLEVMDADRLRVGDRVMVYGDMDENWFGKRQLEANYLVRTNVYHPRG